MTVLPGGNAIGWLAAALDCVALAMATPVDAAATRLTAYITDESKDIYVALYGRLPLSFRLSERRRRRECFWLCRSSATIAETTLTALKASHELSHPRIPARPKPNSMRFPADTPIWFDLEAHARFYMPSPTTPGPFLFHSRPM